MEDRYVKSLLEQYAECLERNKNLYGLILYHKSSNNSCAFGNLTNEHLINSIQATSEKIERCLALMKNIR
jgi:hypothetical protein